MPHSPKPNRPLGQGWSVENRQTTSFQELGEEYKGRTLDKAEVFREAVGGIVSVMRACFNHLSPPLRYGSSACTLSARPHVLLSWQVPGYAGHAPGAKEHFGSTHVGIIAIPNVADVAGKALVPGDHTPPSSRRATPRGEPSPAGARRDQARMAHQLAVAGAERGRYATEATRTGPREQEQAGPLDLRSASPRPSRAPTSMPSDVLSAGHRRAAPQRDGSRGQATSTTHAENLRAAAESSIEAAARRKSCAVLRDRASTHHTPSTPPRAESPRGSYAARGGQPPRPFSPPLKEMPAVGYTGHRAGERDLNQAAIRAHVDAYMDHSPNKYAVHAKTDATRPAGYTRGDGTDRAAGIVLGSRTPRGTPRGAHNRPQPAFYESPRQHERPTGGFDGGFDGGEATPPLTPTSSRRGEWDHQAWREARRGSSSPRPPSHWVRPSFDGERKSTPPSQTYKSAVNGLKLGYAGHVPQRSDNVGASDFGGSVTSLHSEQRDHYSRVHKVNDMTAPVKDGRAGRAERSAVGYGGHKPTDANSVGTSYWQSHEHRGGTPRAGRNVPGDRFEYMYDA